MAVDVGISHMTLLIVALAFSLVNICLIIATGGIVYNWQDRYMGPILACQQPKWNSDGRSTKLSYGNFDNGYNYYTNNYNNNNNVAYSANANYNANTGSVSGSVSGTYQQQPTGSVAYGSGTPIASASWTSWYSNGWSTCPIITYPRWAANQPTVQVQQPTVYSQPTVVAQPTYVAQPSVVVSQPTVYAQPGYVAVGTVGK